MQPLARTRGPGTVLDALPEAVVLTLVVALPAFLNLATARVFEEEKVMLLRAGALLIVAGGAWSWRRSLDLVRHPIPLLCGVLTLALAISTLTAIDPLDALFGAHIRLHGLLTWLALVVTFIGACQIARSEIGRRRLAAALALGSVWPCVYALIQMAGVDPISWSDVIPGRTPSTVGSPLMFAGYLVAVIPATAIAAVRSPAYAACLVLQLAALVATGSRGPTLALSVAALIFAIAIVPARRWRVVLIGASGIAAAAAIALVLVPEIRPAFAAPLFETTTGSGRVRILIWQGIRQLMAGSGWRLWLGHGPESLRHIFPPYYVPEIGLIEQSEAMPDRAHNELLDMLVNAGLLGVICEIAFFVVVVVGALRVGDRRWRAGLAAAAVAHILEIQLGIATVASRMVFLTVAALAVGFQMPHPRTHGAPDTVTPPARLAGPTLVLAAGMSAAAPLLFTLYAWGVGGDRQGDSGELTAYLHTLSLASPLLCGGLLLSAIALAWAISAPRSTRISFWPQLLTTAVAIALALLLSISPSRADVFASAGAGFERDGQVRASVIAYREASRVRPNEEAYLTNLGRALTQEAASLEEPERTRQFEEARSVLEHALQRNPHSPYPPRNLASMLRVRARVGGSDSRAPLLEEADRQYQVALARAPQLPELWIEWANVDAERRQFDGALAKLQTAIELDDTRADPWILRGLIHALQGRFQAALADYETALLRGPREPAALRGRAIALAELRRPEDAIATLDELLSVAPGDVAALQLRQRLNADQ